MPESLVQDTTAATWQHRGPCRRRPGATSAGCSPKRTSRRDGLQPGRVAPAREAGHGGRRGRPAGGGPRGGAPWRRRRPAGPPRTEERRQRAEHLRQQRDALIAKRNADREQKIDELPARRGRHAADMTFATAEERRAAGRRLIAELTPRAAAPGAARLPDAAAAADQMRRALTAQLRQTLCHSMVSDAGLLQDEINQLHMLRRQGAAP
ncbi:unnamed protein product [Prorocentrum cordatum]|uniref:Uncharacterized protein n=1 Tax=Prorocentrum cordatum TaxID=2364126 RepID=A0ABN9XUC7_9DINO|nr:unnamed protein product [Polarella glacialis]